MPHDATQPAEVTPAWPNRFILEPWTQKRVRRGELTPVQIGWQVVDLKSQQTVWRSRLKKDAERVRLKLEEGDEAMHRWTGVWYIDHPEDDEDALHTEVPQ